MNFSFHELIFKPQLPLLLVSSPLSPTPTISKFDPFNRENISGSLARQVARNGDELDSLPAAVVGEWSSARPPGCSSMTSSAFFGRQVDLYRRKATHGMIFWCWADGAGRDWSLRDDVRGRDGVIYAAGRASREAWACGASGLGFFDPVAAAKEQQQQQQQSSSSSVGGEAMAEGSGEVTAYEEDVLSVGVERAVGAAAGLFSAVVGKMRWGAAKASKRRASEAVRGVEEGGGGGAAAAAVGGVGGVGAVGAAASKAAERDDEDEDASRRGTTSLDGGDEDYRKFVEAGSCV